MSEGVTDAAPRVLPVQGTWLLDALALAVFALLRDLALVCVSSGDLVSQKARRACGADNSLFSPLAQQFASYV